MRRKKERSKQGQTNKQGKATQIHVHVYSSILYSTCTYTYCTSFIIILDHFEILSPPPPPPPPCMQPQVSSEWYAEFEAALLQRPSRTRPFSSLQHIRYIHVHVHCTCCNERWEGRKKEASKIKQTTRQSNTAHPRQSLFLRRMSCLGWDSNPRHSTL